jgi:ABC-type uncharacterized transport system ATPase subunit
MMTKCVKCGYVCAACLNRLDEPVDGPGDDNQQYTSMLKNLQEQLDRLPSVEKYTELMEACETAVDIMHASVDNELIVEDRLDDVMASVQVIESAIASHGQAAVTRKVETPSETAELVIDDMEPDVMRKAMQGQRETIMKLTADMDEMEKEHEEDVAEGNRVIAEQQQQIARLLARHEPNNA